MVAIVAVVTIVAVSWAAWLVVTSYIVFVPVVTFNTVVYCVYLLVY